MKRIRKTNGQTDGQTDKHTDTQTQRHTDRLTTQIIQYYRYIGPNFTVIIAQLHYGMYISYTHRCEVHNKGGFDCADVRSCMLGASKALAKKSIRKKVKLR